MTPTVLYQSEFTRLTADVDARGCLHLDEFTNDAKAGQAPRWTRADDRCEMFDEEQARALFGVLKAHFDEEERARAFAAQQDRENADRLLTCRDCSGEYIGREWAEHTRTVMHIRGAGAIR